MLEKLSLNDEVLISQLERAYGLLITQLGFLSLGADPNATVYRATTKEGNPYFVKLIKSSSFDPQATNLLRFLSTEGIGHIIPPLLTAQDSLWTELEEYTLVLYPFVAGENGYALPLTKKDWLEFGKTLRRLHTLELPPDVKRGIQLETFDGRWRGQVKEISDTLEHKTFEDATSTAMASFLQSKRGEILGLVAHAERFAGDLGGRALEPVLCHADLHAGNLLIDDTQNFYIVDWDAPILAPKERDLMFVGGGLGFRGFTPQEEESLFFQGYGPTDIDPVALAYYRFERIVQDIAVYGDELVRQLGSDEDRKASLHYLEANFEPGGTVERAYAVGATGIDSSP